VPEELDDELLLELDDEELDELELLETDSVTTASLLVTEPAVFATTTEYVPALAAVMLATA